MQRGGTFFRLTSGSADNPDYFLNRVQVLCKDSFFLLQVTFLNKTGQRYLEIKASCMREVNVANLLRTWEKEIS